MKLYYFIIQKTVGLLVGCSVISLEEDARNV